MVRCLSHRVAPPVVAVALLLMPAWAGAQATAAPDGVAGQVDPDAAMAPLPDLGVEWPDLAAPSAEPATAAPDAANAEGAVRADREQRYSVQLLGIGELNGSFRTRFDQLSALVTNEGK